MKVQSTHPRHREVRYGGNGVSRRKGTSPFDLYGALIAWGWLDGGGKSCLPAGLVTLGHQSFRVALRQSASDLLQKRRSVSFGCITVTTMGAPIRTGGASPLRVATGGEASFEARKPSPPLAPPVRIHGARTSLMYRQKPSPFGLRHRASNRRSKLDSYRTPYYD